jgi:hypothetical protein
MDETVMNNNELTTWRMIGADMGFEFDELGHPYRTVNDLPYMRDWRPLDDDSDCIDLLMHYHLSAQCELEGVIVRDQYGPIMAMTFYETEGGKREALRKAVFEAAAKVVRAKLQLLDKETACVKAQ